MQMMVVFIVHGFLMLHKGTYKTAMNSPKETYMPLSVYL